MGGGLWNTGSVWTFSRVPIVAIYIKYVQCGINYSNKQALHLAMVQGYAEGVNTLFKLQKFAPPADLTDQNNMTAILVNNLLKRKTLQSNGVHLITPYLTSYDKCPRLSVMKTWSIISFSTSWL
jgi:hypothetical protein